MRKKLLALLAGLIIMIPAALADTTFDLVGGFSGITTPTSIGIGFGTTGNSGGTQEIQEEQTAAISVSCLVPMLKRISSSLNSMECM